MNIRQSATLCGAVLTLLPTLGVAPEAPPTMEEVW
jgi:hypothetical protein